MANAFILQCAVKNYEWGKLGLQSLVAQLSKSAFNDFVVNENTPYAELWMGTHSSGPSLIPSENNILLKEWIRSHPESLGRKIRENFGESSDLPFLFKVLSVRKALSIQAHPDKITAQELFKKFRDHYPDDNHKPEMAIALTPFELLCGFRPVSEIKALFNDLPPLQAVVGQELSTHFLSSKENSEKDIKILFTALMKTKKEQFETHLEKLVKTFKNNSLSELCSSVKDIFIKLNTEYPGDIGCFCLFFLNYLKLEPGQAIFLAANEPHAYLQGDCIECMACSDNVVRAGLTPKFKDVNTLCNILTYKCKPGVDNLFPGIESACNPCVTVFDPPVKEFTIAKIKITTKTIHHLEAVESASLLIVIEGEATANIKTKDIKLCPGTVLFISSGCNVQLEVTVSDLLLFRAYCS